MLPSAEQTRTGNLCFPFDSTDRNMGPSSLFVLRSSRELRSKPVRGSSPVFPSQCGPVQELAQPLAGQVPPQLQHSRRLKWAPCLGAPQQHVIHVGHDRCFVSFTPFPTGAYP